MAISIRMSHSSVYPSCVLGFIQQKLNFNFVSYGCRFCGSKSLRHIPNPCCFHSIAKGLKSTSWCSLAETFPKLDSLQTPFSGWPLFVAAHFLFWYIFRWQQLCSLPGCLFYESPSHRSFPLFTVLLSYDIIFQGLGCLCNASVYCEIFVCDLNKKITPAGTKSAGDSSLAFSIDCNLYR